MSRANLQDLRAIKIKVIEAQLTKLGLTSEQIAKHVEPLRRPKPIPRRRRKHL